MCVYECGAGGGGWGGQGVRGREGGYNRRAQCPGVAGGGLTGRGNARGECEGKISMAAMRQPCGSNQVVRV